MLMVYSRGICLTQYYEDILFQWPNLSQTSFVVRHQPLALLLYVICVLCQDIYIFISSTPPLSLYSYAFPPYVHAYTRTHVRTYTRTVKHMQTHNYKREITQQSLALLLCRPIDQVSCETPDSPCWQGKYDKQRPGWSFLSDENIHKRLIIIPNMS